MSKARDEAAKSEESLWARIDARAVEVGKKESKKEVKGGAARQYRWVVDAIVPFSLVIVVGIGVM